MQAASEVDWKEIHARHETMERIAICTLVPRIQELDATLSMLVHLHHSGDEAKGYSSVSLIRIMITHVHELARDCLKITDEMVGIDSDTSPLGDDEPQSA